MNLLLLGGPKFVGRAVIEAALGGGHEVTLFNRGTTGAELYPEVERIVGDRDGGLDGLRGREWDAVIEAGTGTVLVLPKSGVQSLRVKMPRPLPARTGAGLLAGGIILTTVGTPVFLTGLVFLALSPGYVYIHLPMLLTGGGALAGGIPLIVRGARNRRAYLEAVQERSLMPVVSRAPGGWTGGIRFRF